MRFINFHRFRQAVCKLASERGYTGDPWSEYPRYGSLDDHLAIVELELDVRPIPRTRAEKAFVRKIASAVVLGPQQTSHWEVAQ